MFSMWFSFLFLSLVCFVSAEVVSYSPCTYIYRRPEKCKINKVEVIPCPEAEDDESCSVYKNSNSTVLFEFTPDFNATSITAQSYSATLLVDIPLPGQDRNGCHYTSCPIVAGKKHTFKFTLPIAEYYPAGPYVAKWKIWNDEFHECCFTTNIKIV